MPDLPFRYSALPGRPALEWPNGARVAFYVAVNVEHFEVGKPGLSLEPNLAQLFPDPLNYGWRDYGARVGIWRLIDAFDRIGLPVTAMLNSDVCTEYPEIVAAGRERSWSWVGHGKNNSTLPAGMSAEEERAYIAAVLDEIERGTGTRPRGWLGPALSETYETAHVLADLGVTYVLDWGNDDQPYPLDVRAGKLLSVPYGAELNDIPAFVIHGWTAPNFAEAIVDQVDTLEPGRVFGLGLHPFLSGQAYRCKHVERALAHVVSHDDVWVTTCDEIAEWYLKSS